MERKILSAEEIAEGLQRLPEWTVDALMLKRRYEFRNFAEALAFVNRVGAEAEALDHHPDITFGWGYAEIATTTHDRGGVTDVDFALARMVERLGAEETT